MVLGRGEIAGAAGGLGRQQAHFIVVGMVGQIRFELFACLGEVLVCEGVAAARK